MANQGSFQEAAADALPLGVDFVFYYVSTPQTPCSALFSAAPGQVEEKTCCESHFLAVALPPKDGIEKEVLVFAIEVLVFTTPDLTTIFVSKADSTGYLHSFNLSSKAPSILKTICTTFLSFLLSQYLPIGQVVLSLFARSQDQYLFPGSIGNPGKHVLDDRQLIKWWCRTLDPALRRYPPLLSAAGDASSEPCTTSEAYLIVPGCDKTDIRAFFPSSTRAEQKCRWLNGYPLQLLVPDPSAPPRCLIPRLPDDPKARFLSDLDAEIPEGGLTNSGRWRSVQSLDEFWEMMSYRQECSSGRLVGFVWIVFTPDKSSRPNSVHADVTASVQSTKSDISIDSHHCVDPVRAAPMPNSSPNATPRLYRNHIIAEAAYESLMMHLLQDCDFSTQALAASSTASWVAKAFSLFGKEPSTTTTSVNGAPAAQGQWGAHFTGRKETLDPAVVSTTESHWNGRNPAKEANQINMLTGIRKKRKINTEDRQVNVSQLGLVFGSTSEHTTKQTSGIVTPTSITQPDPTRAEEQAEAKSPIDRIQPNNKKPKVAD